VRVRIRRRGTPLVSVVVPAYDVAAYLPACLDSVLAQTHRALEVVVVDDGSPDDSAAIAERYAERDPRVRLLRQANRGLGGARNAGAALATGDFLAFLDADDELPREAIARLVRAAGPGVDLVVGNVVRFGDTGPGGAGGAGGTEQRVPWMDRLHAERAEIGIREHPELLGDVFAWNKLYRRSFWDAAGLSWPERVRYEDQPTTTAAYLAAGRIAVLPDVVYRWRVRADGSSITQQRASLADLTDRWTTKRMTAEAVAAYGDPQVSRVFRERVLPGDLWQYFRQIDGADDAWWALLVAGVREHWGEHGSLTRTRMRPAHRLTGWFVEQDRRAEAAEVMRYAEAHGGLPRVRDEAGVRIDVPTLDLSGVPRDAVALRPDER
jgi:CDP-glycerol glycerophosphotransferase